MLEAPALLLHLHPQRLPPLFSFFPLEKQLRGCMALIWAKAWQEVYPLFIPCLNGPSQWGRQDKQAQQTWVQGLSLPPVGRVTCRACHYLTCTVRTESSDLPGK